MFPPYRQGPAFVYSVASTAVARREAYCRVPRQHGTAFARLFWQAVPEAERRDPHGCRPERANICFYLDESFYLSANTAKNLKMMNVLSNEKPPTKVAIPRQGTLAGAERPARFGPTPADDKNNKTGVDAPGPAAPRQRCPRNKVSHGCSHPATRPRRRYPCPSRPESSSPSCRRRRRRAARRLHAPRPAASFGRHPAPMPAALKPRPKESTRYAKKHALPTNNPKNRKSVCFVASSSPPASRPLSPCP